MLDLEWNMLKAEVGKISDKPSQTIESFSPIKFWKERWEKEQEKYIPCSLQIYKHNLKAIKALISKHKIILENRIVLDVGCGRGLYSEFYARRRNTVICCDVSEWVVERMQSEGRKAVLWDFSSEEEFPFANQKYYLVHCFQTLVHVIDDKKFKIACANLGERVEEGGYIIVGDRFLPDRKMKKAHIRYRTTVDYIMTIAKENTGIKFLGAESSFPLGGRVLLFKKGVS